ncbi:MAG: ankyrin repeat domain-containing protein [Candidatus Omnitrophica bacterium]|nr:ankyrin repeat domain-containing protein [Candidatus Omnitrophota bacterium]
MDAKHFVRVFLLSLFSCGLIGCATIGAPVYDAAGTNNPALVRQLINQGQDVNATNQFFLTPLHMAAINGNEEITRMLLEQGAMVDGKIHSAYCPLTPLMQCCYQSGNPGVVRLLVNYRANVNAINPSNQFTPLIYAAAYGHLEAVKILLEANADINARDNKGKTATDYAQQYKRTEVLALLRKFGATVAYTGIPKQDLLMAAVSGDREKILSLLEQGADPNLKDKDGKTLLMYAQENNWLDIADLLLKKGANPDVRDKDNFTAQMLAAIDNKTQMLKVFADNQVKIPYSGKPKEDLLLAILFADYPKAQTLINQGADVNSCYRFNSPLLNYALTRNDLAAVKLLLDNKANPNKFNDYGISPLWVTTGDKDLLIMLKLFVEKGADTNMVNNWGVNPLMNALIAKNLEAARYLLDKPTDVNACQKKGFTVLQYAILTGDLEIVQKLLDKGAQADPLCVVLAEGRNVNYKNINYPEIAALFKTDVLRRQMLRAQAAVETAQSQDDYAKAIYQYNLAMDVDPNFSEIYYNLGMIQDKTGDYASAISNLRKYLELAPSAPDTQTVQDMIYKIEYKRDAGK